MFKCVRFVFAVCRKEFCIFGHKAMVCISVALNGEYLIYYIYFVCCVSGACVYCELLPQKYAYECVCVACLRFCDIYMYLNLIIIFWRKIVNICKLKLLCNCCL